MKRYAGETVTFTNATNKHVNLRGGRIAPGAHVQITLARDWDTDEGLGEGGPWGWGGFTSELLESLETGKEAS